MNSLNQVISENDLTTIINGKNYVNPSGWMSALSTIYFTVMISGTKLNLLGD